MPRWVFRYIGNKTFDFSSKKKDFLPKNDQIWPKIGIFGQLGPGHAGLFPVVGRLVVVARGLYLARHPFTLYNTNNTIVPILVCVVQNIYLPLEADQRTVSSSFWLHINLTIIMRSKTELQKFTQEWIRSWWIDKLVAIELSTKLVLHFRTHNIRESHNQICDSLWYRGSPEGRNLKIRLIRDPFWEFHLKGDSNLRGFASTNHTMYFFHGFSVFLSKPLCGNFNFFAKRVNMVIWSLLLPIFIIQMKMEVLRPL